MSEELDQENEQLVLGELLNHVLDKGVVITGDITLSVAQIDLVRLGVSLYLSSVEALETKGGEPQERLSTASGHGLSVLPSEPRR